MKRFLPVVAAVGLAAFLTACSGNADSSTDTNTSTPTPTAAASGDTGGSDTDADEIVEDNTAMYGPYANDEHDFGGMSVRIFFPWNREPQAGSSEDVDRLLDRIAYFEDKWNFDLEWVEIGWDNYIARYVTTTMAGDPMGEFGYIISRDLYPSFISSGLAYDLSSLDVFDKHTDEYPALLMTDASTLGGKTYAVAENFTSAGASADGNGTGVFFNMSLLDREGLEDPHDLYLNGDWTWDKLFEMATAATKDTTGDGEIDQIGITGRYHQFAFIAANGGSTLREENGDIVFALTDDAAVDALNYYAEKRALPIWGGFGNWDSPMVNFASGKIAFNISQWWTANSYYKADQMSDDWGWVPFPEGENSNGNAALYGDEQSYLWMPVSVKNPKEAAIVFEAITKDPFTEADEWIYNVENLVRSRKTIEVIEKVIEEYPTMLDLYKGFGLEGTVGGAFGQIERGENTALAAMQSIEQQVYAAIEDSLNRDLASEAENTLARAEMRAATEEVLNALREPVDFGEEGAITSDNMDEVRELVEAAEAAIQVAIDSELFTESEIEGFSGYSQYAVAREAVAE